MPRTAASHQVGAVHFGKTWSSHFAQTKSNQFGNALIMGLMQHAVKGAASRVVERSNEMQYCLVEHMHEHSLLQETRCKSVTDFVTFVWLEMRPR